MPRSEHSKHTEKLRQEKHQRKEQIREERQRMRRSRRIMLHSARRYFVAAAIFCMLCELLCNLFELVKGGLLDQVIRGADASFTGMLIRFFVILFCIPLCFYLYSVAYERFQVRCLYVLRRHIFRNILGREYGDFIRRDESYYKNAYVQQTDSLVFSYFYSLFGLLQIIAALLGAMIILAWLNPWMLLFTLAGVAPAILLPKLFEQKILQYEKQSITAGEANIARLHEFLSGLQTIINYGRMAPFQKRFEATTEAYRTRRQHWYNVVSLSFRLTEATLVIYNLFCVLFTAALVSRGQLSVGDYAAALGIMNNVLMNVPYASFYFQQLRSSHESFLYLADLLDQTESRQEQGELCADPRCIEFDDVRFAYPGQTQDVLRDLSFELREKGVYLIEGPSGSGKTSLVNLLLGYYAPLDGQIRLNDVPIQQWDSKALFAITRQENCFFKASLKENLTLFRDLDDERVLEAMRAVGLAHDADRETLHAPVGSYSGGEARRMMILRALLSERPILIFDEPLAGLDAESIRAVEHEIAAIRDRFVIVISHQPLSIPCVTRICLKAVD